ncbi:MAG TPA: SwmB domain-containing protein, partial [Symbiobacteriaceae bacterium]|nr:SwmB domain-containing protein [Symbiobacteriaceae bacterium]
LTVQYNRPATRPLRDMTGTLVPSLPVTNVDNQTTTPYLISAEVTGNRMSLGIFARLDPTSLPPTTAFVVKENGKPIAVTTVTIIEQEVALKLERVVGEGSTVTVSYTGKGKPIQSWAAEAVEPFQDAAVAIVPHTTALQDARVDGNRLTLTYDAPLDPAATPTASSYNVMTGATKASVSKVTVQANRVMLTLAAPVQDVDTVTVSYTPGKKPLYDVFGQQVGALPEMEAVNVTLIPVLTDARVNGTVLTLTFSEELNPAKVPSTKDFTLKVWGQPGVRVTRVKISGATVELTLSQPLSGGINAPSSQRWSYTPGSVPLQGMNGTLVGPITDRPF